MEIKGVKKRKREREKERKKRKETKEPQLKRRASLAIFAAVQWVF